MQHIQEDDLLVARTAQGLIGACHGPPEPAEYPEVEELLDCFKHNSITLDPSILVEYLPMPSSTKKLLERVAAEDANGEVWSSQFDVLAKMTEIAGLLERLSAGKRDAFDSPAGKNPLGNFIHGLVTIAIEAVGGQVKAAATAQVTSLEPYHSPLSGTVDGASRQQ